MINDYPNLWKWEDIRLIKCKSCMQILEPENMEKHVLIHHIKEIKKQVISKKNSLQNHSSINKHVKIVSNKGFESVVTGDDKKIVINVISNPNLSKDSLRSEISEVIGIEHAVININVISEFPRLDNGKIDYKFLNCYSKKK